MRAELLHRERYAFDDGTVVEMVIWRLEAPVAGSSHPYKYRLYYGRTGVRTVGYDNERGKGDHWHRREREGRYRFSTVERLIDDFLRDVASARAR